MPPEPPAVLPQEHWRPRPPAALTVSTSDPQPPAAALGQSDVLLLRLAELLPDDICRAALRAQAIEWYLPMAGYLARRFAGRGEPLADLTQVAVIGLIKAVDRFDATRGVTFAGYATPTILGELKRHFRDTTWNVRVPRRLQELKLQLSTVTNDLAHLLNRSPTTAEVAVRLGVTQHEVLLAQAAATAYRPVSIQQPAPGHDGLLLIDQLAVTDRGIDAVDNRETLRVLLAALSAREQLVIRMRFLRDMTQAEIAIQIGVSQMQVSRLLARSMTRLHDGMLTGPAPVAPGPHDSSTPASRHTRREPGGRLSAAAGPIVTPRG
jgi:RNA polymerase sigma-B factor